MTTAPPPRRRPLAEILGLPAVLAPAAAAGLGSGLMGDGAWDVVASLGIGLSLVAILWALLRSRAGQRRPDVPARPTGRPGRDPGQG